VTTTADDLADLARDVVGRAVASGTTLATAESLTAGLVAATLASVPGVSAVLRGGVVSYTDEVKARLLGVDPEVLAELGAVSAPVAAAMAEGARTALGAALAVSTTGVAGPGPADGVPAGRVFVAVTGAGGPTEVLRLDLVGDRAEVRAATTAHALRALLSRLP
jgi:nicotinamide-nucleotide amidase